MRGFLGTAIVAAALVVTSGAMAGTPVERAIRRGVSKDGEALKPPMAYGYYAGISIDDMAALIGWLRTLPPKKTP